MYCCVYDMKGINVVLNFVVLLTRTLWEVYCFGFGIGLGTSCHWIPKKLPIKVFKSWQKIAIFFQKVCRKVAEFTKSWRKVANIFLPFVPFLGGKDWKFAYSFLSKLFLSKSNNNIRGSFHFTWSTDSLPKWHEQNRVIFTHFMSRTVFHALHSLSMKSIHLWLSLMTSSHQTTTSLFLWFWL